MLNLGNLNVKDLFLGSTKVSSAWLGTQKVWPSLPYDAEVEYLESTGTQWIQTDWIADLTKDFRISGRCGFATTQRGMLMSAYSNNDQSNMSIELYNNLRFRVYCHADTIVYAPGVSVGDMFAFDIMYQSSDGLMTATANGVTRTGVVQSAYRRLNSLAMRIGADYRNMFLYGMFGSIRVENPDLVCDFIPVRFTNENNQSEGAMYDKVTKQLFRNQGTGDFVIGPDMNP